MSFDYLYGLARRTLVPSYGEAQPVVPGCNARGELLVAPALTPKAQLVSQGNTFGVAIATGNAFTYVAAWPTTRAELVLHNGESGDGKCYVVDTAFMVDISSAAAAQAKTLLGQLVPSGAAPTDDTAQLITSRSGRSVYGATYPGRAKRALANTSYAIANKWEVLASVVNPNTASIGSAVVADMSGWIIPPGGVLCLAGLASTAAGTAIIGVTWHEVQLPLTVG